MAAVRANTMQTITSKRILGDGQPFDATISAARARGAQKSYEKNESTEEIGQLVRSQIVSYFRREF